MTTGTGIEYVEEELDQFHSDTDYQSRLNSMYQRIHEAEHLEDILWQLEQDLLALLNAERLTIYRKDKDGREIISWYRTGDELMEEIVLPMSPSSIAGYVAMGQVPLRIDDVYDAEYLTEIHPKLSFDYSFDRATGYLTTSMIVVPIKFKDTLLGVLQIMNRISGGPFTDQDLNHAVEIANVMGQKFRYDLRTTFGPFDLLIQNKRITLEQLEEYESRAREDRTSVTQLLIKEGGLTVDEVGASLEQYHQVPFMRYDPDFIIDEEILNNLNKSYLAENCWVPLSVTHDKAVILINDPNDTDRIMEIQNVLSVMSYEFLVGLKEDILRYLGFDVSGEALENEEEAPELGDLLDRLEGEGQELTLTEGGDANDDIVDPNASTIVQLINKIIVDGYNLNCSDIHIEPSKGTRPAVVRFRIDGMCREVLKIPAKNVRASIARIKVMSNLDITESRKPQDGKIAVKMRGKPLELRVATLPTINGESVIMRILAAGDNAIPFEKLGFSDRNFEACKRMMENPHGIILVVGPTGSGKTTSLHAVLGALNTPDRKILTAEDPVEITQHGLQQVQVMPKIGYTFAMALRAFLRCDPDIILIGEMRDHETAHSGIEASLTGHLVFSTLHTNSAPETIVRLLDMGLDPMNFADALIGIVAQRLVRTLCSTCKEPYKPSQEELDRLIHLYGEEYFPELNIDFDEVQLFKPGACEKCGGTGYRGRAGIHEALEGTPDMKKLIAKSTVVDEIRKLAYREGMRGLQQDGIAKIFKGLTDLEQLRRVTAH